MTEPTRIEPVWLDAEVAFAIHDRQLAEHGGGTGVRDLGMLESALGRPINRWAYGEDDLCALAAAYAFGKFNSTPTPSGSYRKNCVSPVRGTMLSRNFTLLVCSRLRMASTSLAAKAM